MNNFNDNDYKVDDFNGESISKSDTNIKNELNKNESNVKNQPNNYENDNLKNVANVAFYRKKPFIFGSIGLISIALLTTAIAVPLSLQQTSFSNEGSIIPGLKPSSPTDFATKLQIVNNLSNNDKINLWNRYVNTSGAMIRWENKVDQPKILNFLKNNFDPFDPTIKIGFTPQGGSKLELSLLDMFKKSMDILIAQDTYYYDPTSNAYIDLFSRIPSNTSFFFIDITWCLYYKN